MYIWDEQQPAIELCFFPGIMVELEGLGGERISQIC